MHTAHTLQPERNGILFGTERFSDVINLVSLVYNYLTLQNYLSLLRITIMVVKRYRHFAWYYYR